MAPLEYPDVSNYQPAIDWQALKAYQDQQYGMSLACIKLSEGTYQTQELHAPKAVAAGLDVLIWYHYARPDLNPGDAGAQKEAVFFRNVLSKYARPEDYVMLDYEGFPGADSSKWTPQWADYFLYRTWGNIGAGQVSLYSYLAFVKSFLQDSRLAKWKLILADYTTTQPPAPSPWTSYLAWQFTDAGTFPGISGKVDLNRWFGPLKNTTPDLSKIKTDLQAAQVSINQALVELG